MADLAKASYAPSTAIVDGFMTSGNIDIISVRAYDQT